MRIECNKCVGVFYIFAKYIGMAEYCPYCGTKQDFEVISLNKEAQ